MKYIRGFDGLRAISIVFVLITHLGIYLVIRDNTFLEKNYNLFSGETGVMIFFSISGFLISSLLLNEKATTGKIKFKYFFIRRFLRLAPPLLVFLIAIVILMQLKFLPRDYIAVLLSFFYLYDFCPLIHYTSELGHTWSLGVEEQFYLLWPIAISRIKKAGTWILAFTIIILICVACEIWYTVPAWYIHSFYSPTSHPNPQRWFIPACLPIIIGSLTAILMFANRGYFQSMLHKNYLVLPVPFLLFIAQIYLPDTVVPFIKIITMPLGISSFLLWLYFNPQSIIANILEFKPISFLGKISYGVYVYQGLFLRTGPGGSLLIQSFPLNICLVLITASISYYFMERKIMKYKERFRPTNP